METISSHYYLAQSVQRRAGLPRNRVSIPGRVGECFRLHSVQTDSGVHSASYTMSTGDFSRGVKPPGREADNSPASSAEVKNVGAVPALPHTSLWCGA
jgi:hypothetical protein